MRFSKSSLVILILYFCYSLNVNSQPQITGSNIYFYIVPNVSLDVCNYNELSLVFQDNFDGNSLDLNNWRLRYEDGSFGPSQEFNTLNNCEVSNGTLKITAKEETVHARAISWLDDDFLLDDGLPNYREFNYTSSNIWTKKQFETGKIEASIKIPRGKGFWPAFWSYSGNPWNEIDIFEFWNESDFWGNYDDNKLSKVINMTLHKVVLGDHLASSCPKYETADLSADFHRYGVYWDKGRVIWYLDGNVIGEQYRWSKYGSNEPTCSFEIADEYWYLKTMPENPMHIILNLAIQNGGNNPDGSTPFPSSMEIDWVRYYQHSSCIDVLLNSNEDFEIFNEIFNVITGASITIDGTFLVLNNQQLHLISNTEINLLPGFDAKSGSDFIARIDEWVCRTKKPINIQDSYEPVEGEQVSYYPNPSPGSLIVEFPDNNASNYSISIYDLAGQEIDGFEQQTEKDKLILNLNKFKNGNYLLHLVNNLNGEKIIRQFIVVK